MSSSTSKGFAFSLLVLLGRSSPPSHIPTTCGMGDDPDIHHPETFRPIMQDFYPHLFLTHESNQNFLSFETHQIIGRFSYQSAPEILIDQ